MYFLKSVQPSAFSVPMTVAVLSIKRDKLSNKWMQGFVSTLGSVWCRWRHYISVLIHHFELLRFNQDFHLFDCYVIFQKSSKSWRRPTRSELKRYGSLWNSFNDTNTNSESGFWVQIRALVNCWIVPCFWLRLIGWMVTCCPPPIKNCRCSNPDWANWASTWRWCLKKQDYIFNTWFYKRGRILQRWVLLKWGCHSWWVNDTLRSCWSSGWNEFLGLEGKLK